MKYDVLIIGAGPAGMLAAGRAGELGARVLLIEKNAGLGVKLLITGHGRCNITNKIDSPRELAEKYGTNGKFLLSALSRFGVKDIIDFFESRGVKTKVEKGGRVLAASDNAEDVLSALTGYMKDGRVDVKLKSEVRKIVRNGDRIEKVVLATGEEVTAGKFIVCTGGRSYPTTGSTGDGYGWARNLGHTVTPLSPALTPVLIKDAFVKELEGLSLKDVKISAYKDNKKFDSGTGDAIFTANALSGPLVINMSRTIGKEFPGEVLLKIDLLPALDFKVLDERLLHSFQEAPHRLLRNSLDALLSPKLIPIVVTLAGIDSEKKVNSVTKEERRRLTHLLKEFTLRASGLTGFERAFITAGGIDLREVDSKTMKSKLIENLYFAGEILDIDGPTGGYNLQVCWSTGYAAGTATGST